VSEDGSAPAQSDRLEADPMTLLPEFQSQEARHPQIAKMLGDPLHYGGLATAGGAGQEQLLGP
jgi:hypothetical protein